MPFYQHFFVFLPPYWSLIFSLSLVGFAAAQGNTRLGTGALQNNTTGQYNTASGFDALYSNTTGNNNTASGAYVL